MLGGCLVTAPTRELEPHGGGLRAYLPGLGVLTSYEKAWLPRDLVAGLVLSALLVPQGMAYAELAGLPPITGLYTSILCLLGYAVFGPSRVLVLGPDSSLGIDDVVAQVLPADKAAAVADLRRQGRVVAMVGSRTGTRLGRSRWPHSWP